MAETLQEVWQGVLPEVLEQEAFRTGAWVQCASSTVRKLQEEPLMYLQAFVLLVHYRLQASPCTLG